MKLSRLHCPLSRTVYWPTKCHWFNNAERPFIFWKQLLEYGTREITYILLHHYRLLKQLSLAHPDEEVAEGLPLLLVLQANLGIIGTTRPGNVDKGNPVGNGALLFVHRTIRTPETTLSSSQLNELKAKITNTH